ncbi:hypothetical protein L6452_36348 [Arctium lappa]|uniref:Uncharacterized protein n=1 Tax=Arctium lappa TaxID=4217 RepID=A0ACB8YA27_ARCLA|nr:hypothetical protein L6452_36348 [Arctium lappa]
MLRADRKDNLYRMTFTKHTNTNSEKHCLVYLNNEDAWLWHKKFSHLNFSSLDKLVKLNLVNELPSLKFEKDLLCSACEMGKLKKASHRTKTKSDVLEILINLLKRLQVLFSCNIQKLRSDNGTKFRNAKINSYLSEEVISPNFYAARTPEQNGVVERNNRTLVEAARTMPAGSDLPTIFWAEAVSTTYFTQNRATIVKRFKKVACELINNRRPNVKYFHVFRCMCFILNDRDQLTKFDKKANVGKFIGYSLTAKAFRVLNLRTRTIQESINVSFDEKESRSSKTQNSHSQTKEASDSSKLRESELNKIFDDFFFDEDNSEFIFRDNQRA